MNQRSHRARSVSLTILLAVIVGAAVGVILSAAGAASSSSSSAVVERQLHLVAVPTRQAFVDNADDRNRGSINNPFGNTTTGAARSSASEQADGPFPGDEGLFAYALYRGADRTQKAGTAVVVCQYGFAKSSLCSVSYRLTDGTLTGAGSFDARTDSADLTITGGTGAYRGAKGDVNVSAPSGTSPLLALRTQQLAFRFAQPATTRQATGQRLYSVAVRQRFVHNGDDEARGRVSNPFHRRYAAAALGMPSPGDQAFFRFAVYRSAATSAQTGAATFTCDYAFGGAALCQAEYRLAGGTLLAAGSFGLDAMKMSLAITGGTGRYRGATGDLLASPSTNHTQQLAFTIQRNNDD